MSGIVNTWDRLWGANLHQWCHAYSDQKSTTYKWMASFDLFETLLQWTNLKTIKTKENKQSIWNSQQHLGYKNVEKIRPKSNSVYVYQTVTYFGILASPPAIPSPDIL